MHPALLYSQCKTGSQAGCSKAAGSGAENACVQVREKHGHRHSLERKLAQPCS